MHPPRAAFCVAAAGCLALALAAKASATIVAVQYTDRNATGGFPNNGGPLWTGVVDTVANSLTINAWTDLPGTPSFWSPLWTPDLTALPLVWPAVTSTGASYDVPDDFLGQIDATFAFISPVSAQNMLWNEGDWGVTATYVAPAYVDFYPGWGGARKPVNINGELAFVYDVSADETEMPMLPIGPLSLAGSTGASVVSYAPIGLELEAVPEASSVLFGCVIAAGATIVGTRRRIRRRRRNRPLAA